MIKGYSEVTENWGNIAPYVNRGSLVQGIFLSKKCFFYDTCSFRYHANLKEQDAEKILEYIRQQDGIIVITRCILMELASQSHSLEECYVRYVKKIADYGIALYVIYEEELQDIMESCFASRQQVNNYLIWAIRMINSPVSTIAKTLLEDEGLRNIVEEKSKNTQDFYTRFFSGVRKNKETGDNLGEEMLAVCLHVLVKLPEEEGKFCVITDDKGAAGKIDASFRRVNRRYRGKRVILFSTPKLVQALYNEGIAAEAEELLPILHAGNNGIIKILGAEIYDIDNREITLDCADTARKIVEKKIHIAL